MKRQNVFRLVKSLIFAITIFIGFTINIKAFDRTNDVAGAKGVSEQTISVIANNLTKKLREDLANNSVTVKVNGVEKYQALKGGVEIEGSGICILTDDNNQLPIRFDVKLNAGAKTIAEIKYDFVQYETSAFAPSSSEEILMKELMKKVSVDYQTNEIVISIDGFETVETTDGKEYVGNGEIKIGEVEWRKIKFDVVLTDGNPAARIKYEVQK